MTYVLLHADRLRSVVADDPLVPAADVASVRDAAALLVEASRLRDAAEADIAAARSAAHGQGVEEGREQGRQASEARLTEAIARLEAQAVAREAERRADVGRLAIEVIRRIAGDVGDAAIVAGLAERAVAGVGADTSVVVRVAPAAVDAVRARLGDRAGLVVEDDPAMAPLDCVLDTPLGRTHAGLETQLGAIERAWASS